MTPLGSFALLLLEQLRAQKTGWEFTPLALAKDKQRMCGLIPHIPAPINVSPLDHFIEHAPEGTAAYIRVKRHKRLLRFIELTTEMPFVPRRHKHMVWHNATQPLLYINYYRGTGWYAPKDSVQKWGPTHQNHFGKSYPENVEGYETYVTYPIYRVHRASKRKKIYEYFDVWNMTEEYGPADRIITTLEKSWEDKRERFGLRGETLLVDFQRTNYAYDSRYG
jgi:hypothetical protein